MAVTFNNLNPGDLLKNLRRCVMLLWHTSRSLALLTLALHIIQALLPVLSLYLIKVLVEGVTGKLPFSQIVPIIVYFVIAQLVLALVQQYANYILTIYQPKLTDYLSKLVLNKAVNVSYAYYENPAYHDNLHLAQQQSLHKAGILLTSFTAFITSGFALLFLLLFFISMQSLFALCFIALSVPLAAIKWYYGIAIMQQERKLTPLERESSYLHHVLTGVSFAKETRVFGFGSFFIDKFTGIRTVIRLQKQRLNRKLSNYSLLAESAEIIAMAVIFAILSKKTIEGAVSLGLFVVYIQGFQSLQNNSRGFLQSIVQILQQRIFLQDLFLFLDIPVSSNSRHENPFPVKDTGLVVSEVSFSYDIDEKKVLHNISLQCRPGQIIAIVGQNGSGKSTLIKLLAGLYETSEGIISFDNTPIQDIDSKIYQSQTVFLFQDFEKYFFTIEENIVLGQPDNARPMEDMWAAAEASGAAPVISKLPEGYQTRMGRIFEGSAQLSGGEWQKIALARIFYRKNAQLIVLDEPTSALDAPAEYEVFKQIRAIAKNKMVILVTHRLYNLKIADHLYVMQDGRIAENGSFDDLIAKNGVFTQLYNMQQL